MRLRWYISHTYVRAAHGACLCVVYHTFLYAIHTFALSTSFVGINVSHVRNIHTQDAIIMNLDDLLCVGATDNILLSSTIGRNKNLIPGEVLSSLINGTEEVR